MSSSSSSLMWRLAPVLRACVRARERKFCPPVPLLPRVSPSLFRSLNVSVKVSGPTHRSPLPPPLPLLHSTHEQRCFSCVLLSVLSLCNVYTLKEKKRERVKVNYMRVAILTLHSYVLLGRLLFVYHLHISLTPIWFCRLHIYSVYLPMLAVLFPQALGCAYFSFFYYSSLLFYLSISPVPRSCLSLSNYENDTHESSSHAYT